MGQRTRGKAQAHSIIRRREETAREDVLCFSRWLEQFAADFDGDFSLEGILVSSERALLFLKQHVLNRAFPAANQVGSIAVLTSRHEGLAFCQLCRSEGDGMANHHARLAG